MKMAPEWVGLHANRGLEYGIGKITTSPQRREILKKQQIPQGILCHDEEGLQETSTNTLFSFPELRERFQELSGQVNTYLHYRVTHSPHYSLCPAWSF